MNFGEMLYTLLIKPLKLIFGFIFSCAYNITDNPGLTIIFLSLAVNLLVLPLYLRADALQEEERLTQQKLSKGVAHIKKTFKGDERMMILQTYYRHNDYKPMYVLRSAVSLFLEIPFFIAAYSFLSNLPILSGVSFGPITDLSKPDQMLVVGGVAINVLPVIMTLLNVISTILFTRGHPLKTKLQLYGMAAFFLAFLYTSPSGLVFYWTLNNLFSLIKTIFYKMKDPKRVLTVLASVVGIGSIIFGFRYVGISVSRILFFVALGVALQIPVALKLLRRITEPKANKMQISTDAPLFVVSALLLSVITGLLIPSSVLKASPLEFVNINTFYHPGNYLVSSFLLSAGLFLVWFTVFYRLAAPAGKSVIEAVLSAYSVIAIVNYMFFGKSLGLLSSALQYELGMSFEMREKLVNLLVIAILAAVIIFIYKKYKKALVTVITTICIATACMAVMNIVNINDSLSKVKQQAEEGNASAVLPLSREGKNVVVIMFDRALGEMLPYIMAEKPELLDSYSGFTYYPNTISFGGHTNTASAALFGGYEYTPDKINLRIDEKLVDKQNEALKVMPELFSQNGYDVTVCDPPYAGYTEIPDLSIYDDDPNIHAYITKGAYVGDTEMNALKEDRNRNFFCFGFVKTMPILIQPTLYQGGNYHNLSSVNMQKQIIYNEYTAEGLSASYMATSAVLEHLPELCVESDDNKNSFIMMENDTSHEPVLLQKDGYEALPYVDNSNNPDTDRTTTSLFKSASDRVLQVRDNNQVQQYHANMAAILKFAAWLDYLKEQGLYDNTRIIIVSDHGFGFYQAPELVFPEDNNVDLSYYNPLLMVKDFNATEFSVDETFMTNADVPTLATEGLIDNPVNPYTGNSINSDEKNAHVQYIFETDIYDTKENSGTQFIPDRWLTVHDNLWDLNNWAVNCENSTEPIK